LTTTVAAGGETHPVAHHGEDGHPPVFCQAVGQVREGHETNADQIDFFRTDTVDEPSGKGAAKTGNDHPDAVDDTQLSARRPQRHDINGEVREDHLIGEFVEGCA
jgi:hypothetical protein